MLSPIFPLLIEIILAFMVCPIDSTAEGDLIRFSLIWEIWIKPEMPFSNVTKAP